MILHTHTHTYIYIYILKLVGSRRDLYFFEFINFVLTYVLYICMFPACCFRQRTYVAQGLVNGGTQWDLNSLLFADWMFFSWLGRVLYRGYSPFYSECIYFSLLYPSWIFDMFIVVCAYVCVCVRARWSSFGFH